MGPVMINGVNYSNCNLSHIAFGVPVTGIKGISWSRKTVATNEYSVGQEPTSMGFGSITYEGKITVLKDWWQAVKNAAPNKDPFAILPFNWVISFGNASAPGTPPVSPFTETLKYVRFLEDNLNSNTGDTNITLDIPFIWAGLQNP